MEPIDESYVLDKESYNVCRLRYYLLTAELKDNMSRLTQLQLDKRRKQTIAEPTGATEPTGAAASTNDWKTNGDVAMIVERAKEIATRADKMTDNAARMTDESGMATTEAAKRMEEAVATNDSLMLDVANNMVEQAMIRTNCAKICKEQAEKMTEAAENMAKAAARVAKADSNSREEEELLREQAAITVERSKIFNQHVIFMCKYPEYFRDHEAIDEIYMMKLLEFRPVKLSDTPDAFELELAVQELKNHLEPTTKIVDGLSGNVGTYGARYDWNKIKLLSAFNKSLLQHDTGTNPPNNAELLTLIRNMFSTYKYIDDVRDCIAELVRFLAKTEKRIALADEAVRKYNVDDDRTIKAAVEAIGDAVNFVQHLDVHVHDTVITVKKTPTFAAVVTTDAAVVTADAAVVTADAAVVTTD
jgi:ribosomal protein L17